MNREQYEIMSNYPLDMKVELSKRRIIQFVHNMGGVDNVYIAFSGGKDSTVLLHIARQLYPNIKAVFSNTGLEFPEVVNFVKSFDNIDIVRPKKTFKQVIDNNGYPMISKAVAYTVRLAKNNIKQGNYNTIRVRQILGQEKGSKFNKGKWKFLLDAPFDVTEQCCDYLKKEPLKTYEKKTGRKPIVGVMANESLQRKESFIKTGCNTYEGKKIMSRPLGFWTEQDIYKYISNNNIKIASVYGEIIEDEGIYTTTGEKRTGCIYCGFGVHLEKGENRYQRLKRTHPNLHEYCMIKLGFKEVCEYLNIETE